MGKENVTNIARSSRKLGDNDKSLSSLWDFKPTAARSDKAGSGLFSFKRRKITPSRVSDMDASMEDLFADDI